MAQELTQERLKEVLHYDPETGVFTWKVATNNRVNIGDVASTEDSGYRRIQVDGSKHFAHRLAWLYVFGEIPEGKIDHHDRNPSNNRIANLRPATSSQNGLNRRRHSNNTSGYVGVTWNKKAQKWQAQIKVGLQYHCLGCFNDILDAVAARKAAEITLGVSEFCPQ